MTDAQANDSPISKIASLETVPVEETLVVQTMKRSKFHVPGPSTDDDWSKFIKFKRFQAMESRWKAEKERQKVTEGKRAIEDPTYVTCDDESEEEEEEEEMSGGKPVSEEAGKEKLLRDSITSLEKALIEKEEGGGQREAFRALRFKSPFSDEINETQVPRNLRMPNFKRYDGAGDPDDHVSNFVWAIRMTRMDPKLWCISFAGTLDGSARYWLESLPSRSIHSFQQLCEEFTSSFIQQRVFQQEAQSIFSCRQREGEPNKVYMERFNELSRKMPTRNDPMTIAAFTYGL